LRRPDPQGGQTGRPSRRAALEVRAGDQSEDREGARAHDPAGRAGAGRRSDPVMDRRAFIIGSLALVAAPSAAEGQQAGKTYRIGTLTVSPAERASHFISAFEEQLRGLGYVKGANVLYEHRFADGRTERLSGLATELTSLNVDVIIAGNNASISAARHATSKIPIIMTYGIDPVGVGFVAS